MLIALDESDNRIQATPNNTAICPECHKEVLSKCGNINIWHWAHKKITNCTYGEGMGQWHLKWQDYALKCGADVEVKMINKFGTKRIADIVYNNRVIELQHSGITQDEIIKRSNFYISQKYLVDWVIDYRTNKYIIYEDSKIIMDGRHKRVFDCLFYRFFGNILFDVSNCESKNVLFVSNVLKTRWELMDSNDFGDRYKKHYDFYGYFSDDIIYTKKLDL